MLRLSRKATRNLQTELRALNAGTPARVFAALADPMRLKIIILMRGQKDLCVTDIAELLNVSLPLVSHHLRILKEAGLVSLKRDGQMLCYFLRDSRLPTFIHSLAKSERR